MATVKPIRPEKPVDHIVGLSQARALAWFLERLGDSDSELRHCIDDGLAGDAPESTVGWVHQAIADELRRAHDTIEREYRKLGTNLLEEELAASLKPPKDGA